MCAGVCVCVCRGGNMTLEKNNKKSIEQPEHNFHINYLGTVYSGCRFILINQKNRFDIVVFHLLGILSISVLQ